MSIIGLKKVNHQKKIPIEIIIFGKNLKKEMFLIIGQVVFKVQHGSLMKIQKNIISIYFLKNNLI